MYTYYLRLPAVVPSRERRAVSLAPSFPEILQQQHGGAVRAPAGFERGGHRLGGRAAHEGTEHQIDIAIAVEVPGVERHPPAVSRLRKRVREELKRGRSAKLLLGA